MEEVVGSAGTLPPWRPLSAAPPSLHGPTAVAAVPTFVGYQGPDRITAFSGAGRRGGAGQAGSHPQLRGEVGAQQRDVGTDAACGHVWTCWLHARTTPIPPPLLHPTPLLPPSLSTPTPDTAMLRRLALELSGGHTKTPGQ